MKTRICAVSVALLALFVAAGCDDGSEGGLAGGTRNRLPQRNANDTDTAPPTDPDQKGGTGTGTGPGTGTGTGAGGTTVGTGNTAVLNTYSKVWVTGNDKGPAKLGKLTGAGTMDAAFAWNEVAFKTDTTKVGLMTVYTRSDNQVNGNNSYLQGGVAFATLTDKGIVPGPEVNLPRLNGARTFMRPISCFLTGQRAIVMAASEDNGVNNNPQPVAYLLNAVDGKLIPFANSTREQANKPTNIIQQALADGIDVDNPNDQRGPHTIVTDPDRPDTCIVGMQYNNQAQEAYSVTVSPNNTLKVNWLVRYSDTAQHCRPQVAVMPGTGKMAVCAVEANEQPAEIGFRCSIASTATGKPELSKVVVRSEPKANKYVSEPVIGVIDNSKLAISYGLSAKVRANNNGNGHAGGRSIHNAVLVNTADLTVIGQPALGVGQYGRHGSSFVTSYGPDGAPAMAVISGSSTGTAGGFIQMYPMKSDGTLGVKDALKAYQVSLYSDVANVQARGKNNPNNQARGFINGMGMVPNPGHTTDPGRAATNFMPEVKSFSFSTVTGYSDAEALGKGLKNSIWLSLVPASWTPGLATTPGKPTDKPGVNADGSGPAPRSLAPSTNPSGDVVSSGAGGDVVPDGEDSATHPDGKSRPAMTDSGCSVSTNRPTTNLGLIGLVIAGVLAALRRKREGA